MKKRSVKILAIFFLLLCVSHIVLAESTIRASEPWILDGKKAIFTVQEESFFTYSSWFSHKTHARILKRRTSLIEVDLEHMLARRIDAKDTTSWSNEDVYFDYLILPKQHHEIASLSQVTAKYCSGPVGLLSLSASGALIGCHDKSIVINDSVREPIWTYNIKNILDELCVSCSEHGSSVGDFKSILSDDAETVYWLKQDSNGQYFLPTNIIRIRHDGNVSKLHQPLENNENIVNIAEGDDGLWVLIHVKSKAGSNQLKVQKLGSQQSDNVFADSFFEINTQSIFAPKLNILVSFRELDGRILQTVYNYNDRNKYFVSYDLKLLLMGNDFVTGMRSN